MKYFVTNSERCGTCYHEFYRGKWDGRTFWRDDSVCLHDDVLCDIRGFAEILFSVIPDYAPLGITEVTREQWKTIGLHAKESGGEVYEMYCEADEWADDVFKTHECFTILGI